MTVTLTTEIRNQILDCFPEALPELEQCSGKEEELKVLETHLTKALDEPGIVTKEKAADWCDVVHHFCPESFLQAKFDDIHSIFTQVIYLNSALHADDKQLESVFQETFMPVLITGKVKWLQESVKLGIFKLRGYPYSPWESMLRERLNYLFGDGHVPPTFIMQYEDEFKRRVGSFQLFFKNKGGGLHAIKNELPSLSFSRDYIRSLAFTEFKRMDVDTSLSNMLISPDCKTLKFIDGSGSFPKATDVHRSTCLFLGNVFRPHLSGPFSPSEISRINAIDIDAVCDRLKRYKLDIEAIQVHRCALLMLKLALRRNEGCTHPITLEDLLVITNISDPRGATHQPYVGKIVYIFGKNTLFAKIARVKDKQDDMITKKIKEVFRLLIKLKLAPLPPPPLPPSYTPDQQGIHLYYHSPDSLTYGDYLE